MSSRAHEWIFLRSFELRATRLVPAKMRVDVGKAQKIYTRYLSKLRPGSIGKRGKQVQTNLVKTNGSAILHL